MNRLARERSPYLIQHAHNPVDWFPWGEAAFEKARAERKPIFLSVGYSTCHWCHVMAHESFENEQVAALLNERYVSVKVDREERPDVDRVYMTFVQATTGAGGWPMSVWLTPEGRPFYGGTYFPPTSQWGRPGFVDILREVARVWDTDRAKVEESAGSITARLRELEQAAPVGDRPGSAALERTVAEFRAAFDSEHGGFGGAPKFPRPSELLFLLREFARTGNEEARGMALATLHAMAVGGMRDHVGGGFHRYAVDAAWRVPHFEKMLYDQAQLVLAYLEGAQAAGEAFFAEVAEDTLQYVMRQMTGPDGEFFSAEDADSVPPEHAGAAGAHASEGAFYLWREDEVNALAGEDAAIVRRRFGIEPNGNAPADPQQEFAGKNLLYIASSIDEIATATGRPADAVKRALARARMQLFEARLARPRPHLDDKVLTAWNGLMIAAFARMGRIVRSLSPDASAAEPYLEAARRAARFLRDRLWRDAERRLWHRYRDGEAGIDGYAEDYAFLVFGLLELFQADGASGWLDWAVELQERQDELFWDEARGGWYSTTGADPTVLLRMKEDYDGAEPTAGSVAVLNLLVLSHLVDRPAWADRIDRTFRLFGGRLEQMGRGVPMMSAALSTAVAGIRQVVLVGEDRAELERVVATRYLPFAVTLSMDDARRQELARTLPFLQTMAAADDGSARAYVCADFTCRAPVASADALEAELT
jgi:uncharacterized protein